MHVKNISEIVKIYGNELYRVNGQLISVTIFLTFKVDDMQRSHTFKSLQ